METEEAWESRRAEGRTYQGRLEAIKLTGDPNVPRGEHTFIADDLGPNGIVDGPPPDPRFQGIRTVHSRGHVANTGFIQGKPTKRHLTRGFLHRRSWEFISTHRLWAEPLRTGKLTA